MSRSIAAAVVLAAILIASGGGPASAWWDRCDCEPYAQYLPPPVYVYDHNTGPTWTGNGWAYLPIGAYYPRPPYQIVEPPLLPGGYGDNRARERIWHRGLLPYW
jgi:hypothetical protein